ncbi:hypothetical protein [Streptomyces sp. G-G2]|uniref:hypothetical protein n=1 Tax=Streptomyces sp. G-G2 TaxID=3046201 RepID=UPI0024B90EA7|nr:hypothetical protein [Streptomyces sp. G-G2]MDJ0379336.1 hypothetical protein [Streptomyces sp. G-G2]
MDHELEYRAVLAVDIERSSGRGNVALLRIREVLATALRASFEESGIDWNACLRDDLGDGMRVTAPSGVRKTRLLHPLIHELSVRLRAHNRTAGPATQVRVRAALHAGDVFVGRGGEVTGRPLEVLARLLDAPPARAALAAAPETVTASVLVSQHFHEETVRHGYPGIDPDTFREVTFTVKEHTARAWLHLPGLTAAVTPLPLPQDPAAASEPSHMTNRASGHGVVYATQNGSQHIHINGQK